MKIVLAILLWLAIIMLAAYVPDSEAQEPKSETWLTLSCCSKHWPVHNGFNEDNRGAFMSHHFAESKNYLIVGGYRNSLDRQGYLGGIGMHIFEFNPNNLRVMGSYVIGWVTGYGDTPQEQQKRDLFAMPVLHIRGERFGVQFIGVPGIVVGMGFDIKLD